MSFFLLPLARYVESAARRKDKKMRELSKERLKTRLRQTVTPTLSCLSLSPSRERLSRIDCGEAMPPRRRPWPALQIDVGEVGGGGFAGVAERKEEATINESGANRALASTATTKSIRASYAEAARRSKTVSNSVSASAMLSFCDDGRLKPSAFGAAIRAGREGAIRPSEFSVSAVATTAAAEGAGRAAAAAPAASQQQQQEKPSTAARVGVEGAWRQVSGFSKKEEGLHPPPPEGDARDQNTPSTFKTRPPPFVSHPPPCLPPLPSPPQPNPTQPNQLTEKDVILGGVLGRGASSVVHSGTIASTGEKVAVKRLSAADGATARSIVNELRALAPRSVSASVSSSSPAVPSSSSSSPPASSGLVELRGAYAERGGARLAVVLELMPGGSLADAIARRAAAVRRRARRREREAERERKKRLEEGGGGGGEGAGREASKSSSPSSSSSSSFLPFGLPERAVARVALGALTGLARIRELGLVHRDVKPANILLDGDVVALCERLEEAREEKDEGRRREKRAGGGEDESANESDDGTDDPFSSLNAKVADFGLASAGAAAGGGAGAAFEGGSIAACTTFVGTVTYMSPERATSGGDPGSGSGGGDSGESGGGASANKKKAAAGYSAPADIWALGLTLMEAATGIYPYALSGCGGGKGKGEGRGEPELNDAFGGSNPAAAAARAIAAAGPLALLMQVVTDPAPVLPSGGAGFTPEFADFLSKCLEKDPRRRATARELLSHPWVVSGGRGRKVVVKEIAPSPAPAPPPARAAPLRLPSASFSSSSPSSPGSSGSASPDAAAAAAATATSSPRGARGASASPPPRPPAAAAADAACFYSPERASSPPTLPRSGGGGVGAAGGGGGGARATTEATTAAQAPRLPPPSSTPSAASATAADARALALATVRARFSSSFTTAAAPGARRAALATLYDRGVSLRLEGRPAVLRGARAALDAWDAEAAGRESLGARGEAEVIGVDVLAIGGIAAREATEGAARTQAEEREEEGEGGDATAAAAAATPAAAVATPAATTYSSCCYLIHVTGTVPGPALGPFAAAAAAAAAAGGGGAFAGGGGGRRLAFAEALVAVCSGKSSGGAAAAAQGDVPTSQSPSLPFGGLRITSHTFRTLR